VEWRHTGADWQEVQVSSALVDVKYLHQVKLSLTTKLQLCNILVISTSTMESLGGHGCPQAWARGGTCPLWKCCKMFLCINSYSKMLGRRIIYALFSLPVVCFRGGGATPTPPPVLHPGPAG